MCLLAAGINAVWVKLHVPLSDTSGTSTTAVKCQREKIYLFLPSQLFLSLTLRHSRHNMSPFVICCLGTSYLACQQNDKLSLAMGVTLTARSRISQ